MNENKLIDGDIVDVDTPNWLPLEALIGYDLSDNFMWMGAIELVDGREVHAYKHISTRRYFHLGVDGTAFAYCNGRYLPIPLTDAIDEAFYRWETLFPIGDPHATRRGLELAYAAAAALDEAA